MILLHIPVWNSVEVSNHTIVYQNGHVSATSNTYRSNIINQYLISLESHEAHQGQTAEQCFVLPVAPEDYLSTAGLIAQLVEPKQPTLQLVY